MALIECYECGKTISDRAVACPHCGAPKLRHKVDSDGSEVWCDADGKVTHVKYPDGTEEWYDADGNKEEMETKFSVGKGKKVRFSKGNLYYDGRAFKFEDNQYSSADSWDESHVSHFHWSKGAGVASAEKYNDDRRTDKDVFFTNDPYDEKKANAAFTVNGETGKWRTLSVDEWEYLLNTRTSSTVGGTENARYAKVKVGGKAGLLLFPDVFAWTSDMGIAPANCNTEDWTDVTDYTAEEFAKMEKAGCVFLPAAGYRSGSNVGGVGSYGYYWSATAGGSYNADYLGFNSSSAYMDDVSRFSGQSVRLVCDEN